MSRAPHVILCLIWLAAPVRCRESEAPRPWSSLAPPLRDALQQGRLLYSHQIPQGPFGAQLPTMDDRIDKKNVVFLLDQFSATGLKWIRDGAVTGYMVDDRTVSPMKEQMDEFWFRYCEEAKKRGIRVLATIRVAGMGNKAYGAGEHGREMLAEWCRIAVPALKPWIKDWELGNEPNPEIPPAEYVAACRTVYPIIKEIDPEARVYGGAVAMLECMSPASKGGREPYPDRDSCYLDGLLDAGLLAFCDVFSFHPYRQPCVPENIPEHASEYAPWSKWPDYVTQIKALKARLREASGGDFRIANT